MKVVSSVTGMFWHIVNSKGEIVAGAPKRGHGGATKAQMQAWAADLSK